MDLYRFKVTRDSAVHFVAFFASGGAGRKGREESVACLGFGWIWDGLDGCSIILRNMRAFRLARRAWVL